MNPSPRVAFLATALALSACGANDGAAAAPSVDAGPSALVGAYAFGSVAYTYQETSPGDDTHAGTESDQVDVTYGAAGALSVRRSALGCTLRADRTGDASARLAAGQVCQIGVAGARYTLTLVTGTLNLDGANLAAEYHWTYVLDLGGGTTRQGTLTESGPGLRQ